MDIFAFNPSGATAALAATTTSASIALPGTEGNNIRVHNSSSGVAFCRWTVGASTAVAADNFVAPGGTEVFTISPLVTIFSAILSTGTGTVYAQRGYGL